MERSSGAIRTAYDMQIDGKRGTGRPKQTWKKLTEKECREWKLTTGDPQERSTWRSGVRSAMRAASQLPGKGPTDVDDAPAPARKSKIRLGERSGSVVECSTRDRRAAGSSLTSVTALCP